MAWGWVFGLLAVAGVAVLVVVLVRVLGGGAARGATRTPAAPPAPPPGSSAEAILAERYARGEIDTAEYQERLRALRGE